MTRSMSRMASLGEVTKFVYQAICHDNDFEPGVFPCTTRELYRGGQTCGVYFCVHGPRNVKLTAIWDRAGNVVLFYDSSGDRLRTVSVDQALAAKH